jgi:predicted O-methyltransferase YrrM
MLKPMHIDLILPQAHAYAEAHTTPQDTLLAELEAYTLAHHAHAHMVSGHLQGRFLAMISRMVQPRRVLEVGTFTGYSALCLAEGMTEDGQLHTIDCRPEDVQLARSFFDISPSGDRIHTHLGDAMEIIPTLQESWDLVFLDADKVNYINYHEMIIPLMRPGGWMIADNVLFHGQVLEDPVKGKNAKAIDAYNRHVMEDVRVEQVMLTIRDGLMLIRKKSELA